MVRIRMLSSYTTRLGGETVSYRYGRFYDVDEALADDLIEMGFAEREGGKKTPVEPVPLEAELQQVNTDIPDPDPVTVRLFSVQRIIQLVQDAEHESWNAQTVLDAEVQGKNRTTLIQAMNEILEIEAIEQQAENSESGL